MAVDHRWLCKKCITPARLTHGLGAFIHSENNSEHQISLDPNGLILKSQGSTSVFAYFRSFIGSTAFIHLQYPRLSLWPHNQNILLFPSVALLCFIPFPTSLLMLLRLLLEFLPFLSFSFLFFSFLSSF